MPHVPPAAGFWNSTVLGAAIVSVIVALAVPSTMMPHSPAVFVHSDASKTYGMGIDGQVSSWTRRSWPPWPVFCTSITIPMPPCRPLPVVSVVGSVSAELASITMGYPPFAQSVIERAPDDGPKPAYGPKKTMPLPPLLLTVRFDRRMGSGVELLRGDAVPAST